jgi:small GTP-binding protein
MVYLWNKDGVEPLLCFKGHQDKVFAVAWSPDGRFLASGSKDSEVIFWDTHKGIPIQRLEGDGHWVNSLAFSPVEPCVALATGAGSIILLDTSSMTFHQNLKKHSSYVVGVAWNMDGKRFASASYDNTVRIWEIGKDNEIAVLEGHTGPVNSVSFLADGRLLVTKSSHDGSVRIWRCDNWATVAIIKEVGCAQNIETDLVRNWLPSAIFHPSLPFLAAVGSDPKKPRDEREQVIHIYKIDVSVLLGQSATSTASYASAKVVLVGDSGVGKTGLGWRLAHGEFKEQASTHGQQFWLLNQLSKKRPDGAQCEAVLWDLAGQDDYRLIHALFIDDADLALILFDPTRNDDPLSGVEFWLKQLKVGMRDAIGIPPILVAARTDRGTPRLTQEEIEAFCKQHGVKAYLSTSAKTGEGIDDLIQHMKSLISWDEKPATVTTETFKRIKDFVLGFKENPRRQKVILTWEELRNRLEETDGKWKFSDEEMTTAVGHLATHGYVTRLKTSHGIPRILLSPELLNNLAASFVLEARRNRMGLGSIEEMRLLSGGYKFSELERLTQDEKDNLVDSAAVLFLRHNVCFRETDPLNGRAYLVFPELINLKKPLVEEEVLCEDGVAYTVSGSVENVYASLVVLMGYTQTFTRTNQWRNQARYEMGQGFVCGFRQEEERAGELDFVLYFGTKTPIPVRALFQSLFENFLARRNLTVRRIEPAKCENGHSLNRGVVREQIAKGKDFAFCSQCGDKIVLPNSNKPIQLTKEQADEVEAGRRVADQRSRFEQVLFRLKSYVTEHRIAPPECFISYAWGNPDHEQWVERNLATDLQKAGINVILDKWENRRIGSSIARFVERVEECDQIVVVGTPLYRQKTKNLISANGNVLAAEWDLAGIRMLTTEAEKQTVLPVLLEGDESEAFPALLRGRVYADFRKNEAYFNVALELLLTLYRIQPTESVATELQASLLPKTSPKKSIWQASNDK